LLVENGLDGALGALSGLRLKTLFLGPVEFFDGLNVCIGSGGLIEINLIHVIQFLLESLVNLVVPEVTHLFERREVFVLSHKFGICFGL